MEWTDKATAELEAILARIRSSMADPDVDADEVAQDIKARIEAELNSNGLNVITGENVRNAATRIGVQEITVDPPPQTDEINHQFINGLEKPARFRKKFAMGWFWFAGIILPVLALGAEFFGQLCAQSGIIDPLPTPFHALLIALVPLANLLGWFELRKKGVVKLPVRWSPPGTPCCSCRSPRSQSSALPGSSISASGFSVSCRFRHC